MPTLETSDQLTTPTTQLLRPLVVAPLLRGSHKIPKPPSLSRGEELGIITAPPAEVDPSFPYRRLGMMSSFLLHCVVVIFCSRTFLASPPAKATPTIVFATFQEPVPLPEPLEIDTTIITLVAPQGLPFVMAAEEDTARIPDPPEIAAPLAGDPAPPAPEQQSIYGQVSTINPFAPLRSPRTAGGGFAGRRAEARALLVAERGGSQASEHAVVSSLRWLAEHQLPDGSWRFEHTQSGCRECRNPGYATTTTGATGLALLPFLGAGQTHREGEYRETIASGLNYLLASQRKSARGADLQDGTMYGQGIAAIALCEAYGLTQDPALKDAAQGAIDFIVAAQHHEGGWRYYPNQAGDTTVFGWQMMALQSARLAGLEVPDHTFTQAAEFLSRVEAREGGGFGYQEPGVLPAPTAIGTLSSMFLGRAREDTNLRLGIERLANWGPSSTDVYYNYYATQVLHHDDGPLWQDWNLQLRGQLLDSQSLDGHSRGSWFFPDKHAYAGGRLYTTAMCTMILQVYYRHLPLYGAEVASE